ncbi:DUF2155 domain-containing protein [Dongia sedimenti]|uniref:DUF2155 domain-containing protein n=1 Tax=Dongia sedimenti TaxID=3064282 RepID=A0ABU0YUY9_9PROT|nr:DUF2155 domain-containing protein [Rhodospirillaceae bacterium R-7]
MSLFRFSLAAALLALLTTPAAAIPMDTVLLQGLDKITARVSQIKVPVGGTVTFGALQITARACDKHPPEEAPEAAAFLEVVETKPDEKPVLRFSGWMFASSPALSALEHPVYDLIVLDCVNGDGKPADETTPDESTAPADKDEKAPEPAPQ